jgi:hypothetical protein
VFEQQDSAPFRSFARPIGLAEPEAVVIAAGTRRLIGDLFEYRDLGAVEVKGIAAPVPASQVLGPSAVTSRFAALRGSALTPLVGRDEEIDLLLRRWARAKARDGQVVLVSGEPGIGKSRLAAAAARPVAAVAGRGHPRQSLWPWVAEDREADRALPVVIDPPIDGVSGPLAAPCKWPRAFFLRVGAS